MNDPYYKLEDKLKERDGEDIVKEARRRFWRAFIVTFVIGGILVAVIM